MPSAPLARGVPAAAHGALADGRAGAAVLRDGVVPPEERAAAASVTNVPRSLATALAPLLAGAMLERSSFGWPLVIAGALKVVYDLLLLARFRAVRAPGEP